MRDLKSEIGVTIIPLAQPLPVGSSDLPGGRSPDESGHRAGSPVDASLFGLAPRGVCLATHVTTRAGALLLISNLRLAFRPHRFTHHLRIQI